MHPTVEVFLVACASVGKVFLTAVGGTCLARKDVLTPAVRRGLSGMSAKLLVPCLLLDRLARAATPSLLLDAWPLVPFAFFYVALGAGLARAIFWLVDTPSSHRGVTMAALAFANSQGLPIMMVEVIAPALFAEPSAAQQGVAYIAIYLILFQLLFWTAGPAMLGVPLDSGRALAASSPCAADTAGEAPHVSMIERAVEPDAPGVTCRNGSTRNGGDSDAVEAVDGGGRAQPHQRPARAACATVLKRLATPPVYGILCGLCIALVPPLRWLLLSRGAPLGFAMQAAAMLGDAAVPTNMIILGASLSSGLRWRDLHVRTAAAAVLCKLLLLPLVALGSLAALLGGGSLRANRMLALVILIESATPSANNLITLCELAGGGGTRPMASLIFVQYTTVPVLLTATLTAFMAYVSGLD